MPILGCVACLLTDRRCKLLRCLHTLCVECLEKCISSDNTASCPACSKLTPSPGEGRTHLASLPDCACSSAIDSSASLGFSCDECMQGTAAIATCGDCKLNFCDVHAKAHQLSRLYAGHYVVELFTDQQQQAHIDDDRNGRGGELAHRCAVHNRHSIVQYCRSCSELLCSICVTDSKHKQHADAVVSVRDAEQTYRKEVQSAVESCADNGSSVLSQTIEKIRQEVTAVHRQTEDASEAVHTAVASAVQVLKTRENELLESLDQLRSTTVAPLEEQLGRLQTHVNAGELVSLFMSDCTDAVNFLRMWTWLKEAAVARAQAAESDSGPCRSSLLKFKPAGFSHLTEQMRSVGRVSDLRNICTERSTFTCPQACAVDIQLNIAITAVGAGGETLTTDDAKQSGLEVRVVDNGSGEHHVCELSSVNDQDLPVATFIPHDTGSLTVSVHSAAGDAFPGSPLTVYTFVSKFSSSQKHAKVSLHNGDRTAMVNIRNWHPMCGEAVHIIGQAVYRVRLDSTPESSVVIGMCSAPQPRLTYGFPNDRTSLYAWYDYSGDYQRHFNGGSLGQPWGKGDVIRLTMNCDAHELTACHEPSGKTETLFVNDTALYLYCNILGNSPDDGKSFRITLLT